MTRPTEVHHMRVAVRAALSGRRRVRLTLARTVRQALHDHRAAIISSLHRTLASSAPPAGRGRSQPLSPTRQWSAEASRQGGRSRPAPALEARVLRVVQNHPQGVLAPEIGNEIGVDWRRILASTRMLVEEGLIEQVDHEFYPSRKASRR